MKNPFRNSVYEHTSFPPQSSSQQPISHHSSSHSQQFSQSSQLQSSHSQQLSQLQSSQLQSQSSSSAPLPILSNHVFLAAARQRPLERIFEKSFFNGLKERRKKADHVTPPRPTTIFITMADLTAIFIAFKAVLIAFTAVLTVTVTVAVTIFRSFTHTLDNVSFPT